MVCSQYMLRKLQINLMSHESYTCSVVASCQRRFREHPYMLMVHPGTLGNERSINSSIGFRRGSPSLDICWVHVIFSYFKSGVVLTFLSP